MCSTACSGLTAEMQAVGAGGAAAGPGRGGLAGGGRRQPLDAGRGRGEGAAPVRPPGRQAPHLSGSASGQEPAHRAALRHSPAAHLHHQLPDPRADGGVSRGGGQLRLSRPAAALAGPLHRAADGADGARPALPVGGDAAAAARRAGAEDARERPCRADGVGASDGRGQRLYRQPARPVPAPGRPLVRGAEPAQERRPAAPAGRAPRAAVPDDPQHRHAGRGCRSRLCSACISPRARA